MKILNKNKVKMAILIVKVSIWENLEETEYKFNSFVFSISSFELLEICFYSSFAVPINVKVKSNLYT